MPTIGERFREWFEAPSYEEGVGVDGETRVYPRKKKGMLVTRQGETMQKEEVLGQTNRPASSVVDGGWQGEPCKKIRFCNLFLKIEHITKFYKDNNLTCYFTTY